MSRRKHALGLGPSPAHAIPVMLLQDVTEGTTLLTCVVEVSVPSKLRLHAYAIP